MYPATFKDKARNLENKQFNKQYNVTYVSIIELAKLPLQKNQSKSLKPTVILIHSR